jgi:hypothetical protein
MLAGAKNPAGQPVRKTVGNALGRECTLYLPFERLLG